MGTRTFYTSFLYGTESLTGDFIGNQPTNVSTDISSAYVYEIQNSRNFETVSLTNNFILKQFYDNVIVKSSSLDDAGQFDQDFLNKIYQIDSSLGNLFLKTRYINPQFGLQKYGNPEPYVEITTSGVLNSENIVPDFTIYNDFNQSLSKITFGTSNYQNFNNSQQGGRPITEVREYEGIYLSKYDINIDGFWKETYPWGVVDVNENLTNKIYSEYKKCKVYSFVVQNYDYENAVFYYSTFFLIVLNTQKTSSRLQNFSGVAGLFHSGQCLEINKMFYPFSVITNNSYVDLGKADIENSISGIDTGFSGLNGETGFTGLYSGVYFNYPNFYRNESGYFNLNLSYTGLTLNTMSGDLGGNIMIQHTGGPIVRVADSQLISGEEVFIKVNNVLNYETGLYKDLPDITNALDIYAYNFSSISYVKNDESTESIVSLGSVSNTTQKYSNQTLKADNYFSYKFNKPLAQNGFTFSYNFRASDGVNDKDYIVDFNPSVKKPKAYLTYNSSSDEVVVTSSYATSIDYKFNNEAFANVSVTDTSDGTNQKTTISTSGKTGILFVEVKNYFYDFDSQQLETFSIKNSINLNKNVTIDNFTFQLKRGGVTQTFYDGDLSGLTSITSTTFGQGDIFFYKYYPLNSLTDNYELHLNYTGANLSIKLADDFIPVDVASGSYFELTRSQFESFLSTDKSINISILKDGESQFVLPFAVKTIYGGTPTASLSSITQVITKSPSYADVFLSFSYSYATQAICEIFNQDNQLIDSRKINLDFSTSVQAKTLTIAGVDISKSSGIYFKVTTRSLTQTSGVESFDTATSSTSSYILPLRLSFSNPAVIKFYSDSNLTTEITSITKNKTIYVKLVLFDLLGNEISTSQYANYINISGLTPRFKINNYEDVNTQLKGVTFTRLNTYSYSLYISSDSSINENEIKINAIYNTLF